MSKRRFILSHHRSVGDIVCLTPLVRDIHLTYPGQFEIDVNTTVGKLWENNPYLTRLWNHDHKNPVITAPGAQMISCQYGSGIKEQNSETIHFAAYFHRDFKRQTGITVPMHYPYGDLHLSEYEKSTPIVNGRYWVIFSGGKSDFTIKVWHTKYFQRLVDMLGEQGIGVVQLGAKYKGHWHPKLEGKHVVDLVGYANGDIRPWLQNIYHADGVICGVTGAMHAAAALQKPCVVIGGGREAWWWEAYVNENQGFGPLASGNNPVPHRFLHTIGLLDCCQHHGCWKNKVVPLGNDKLLCKRPVMTPGMPIAECMKMITPNHVMEAVMSYYEDKTLPPIKPDPEGQKLLDAVPESPVTATTCKTGNCQTGTSCKTGTCATPAKKKQRASGSIVIPAGTPLKINPRAKVNVHNPNEPRATKPGTTPDFSDESVIDHPAVGGKFTTFILFYGGDEHFELHKRCLTTFLATTPTSRIDLRVGSNAVGPKTLEMIEDHVTRGFITKHYRHENNDYKYPVMREMFFDPECPIKTKWVLWFDDDSICDKEQNWLNMLAIHIARNADHHMIGAKYVWGMNTKQKEIFQSRPWFKNRPWRARNGDPAPNGNSIIFAAGGFWALTHEAIVACDIPDLGTGLTHTGGDWQIGEQLYQGGFKLKQFNGQKQFVNTSSVPRRGVTMPTVDQVIQKPPTPAATPAPPVNTAVQPQMLVNNIPRL